MTAIIEPTEIDSLSPMPTSLTRQAGKHLNRLASKPVSDAAFTATLPHGIVKLVLGRHLDPKVVSRINNAAKLNGMGLGREKMGMKTSSEAAYRPDLSFSGLESLCVTAMDELAKTEKLWEVKAYVS